MSEAVFKALKEEVEELKNTVAELKKEIEELKKGQLALRSIGQ